MFAAVLGAVAGGAAGVAIWAATCLELECLGVYVAAPIGAVLGAPIGFVVALDIQRWRARRRSDRSARENPR